MKTLTLLIAFLIIGFSHAQDLSERDLIQYISNNSGLNVTQVLQIGDFNYADVNANNINLIQKGTNQEFYFQESSITPSNINVEMMGTNNYLEILGSNSIMENMKITVEGDYRSIIINNYP
jgi:hypothetical protein